MNCYNNIPLNCFNTLVTDQKVFDTLFIFEVEEPICENRYVYVNPEIWRYGLDGKQLSCMSYHFYQWNKALLSMGLTADQMKELNDLQSTLSNFSHRAGFSSGEQHAKSMAILYPPKKTTLA